MENSSFSLSTNGAGMEGKISPQFTWNAHFCPRTILKLFFLPRREFEILLRFYGFTRNIAQIFMSFSRRQHGACSRSRPTHSGISRLICWTAITATTCTYLFIKLILTPLEGSLFKIFIGGRSKKSIIFILSTSLPSLDSPQSVGFSILTPRRLSHNKTRIKPSTGDVCSVLLYLLLNVCLRSVFVFLFRLFSAYWIKTITQWNRISAFISLFTHPEWYSLFFFPALLASRVYRQQSDFVSRYVQAQIRSKLNYRFIRTNNCVNSPFLMIFAFFLIFFLFIRQLFLVSSDQMFSFSPFSRKTIFYPSHINSINILTYNVQNLPLSSCSPSLGSARWRDKVRNFKSPAARALVY